MARKIRVGISIRFSFFPVPMRYVIPIENTATRFDGNVTAVLLSYRVRDERDMWPHRLLSEQRQRATRLRSDGDPVASDPDQRRDRRSQPSVGGVQPREGHQAVHRVHKLKVSVHRAQMQLVSKFFAGKRRWTIPFYLRERITMVARVSPRSFSPKGSVQSYSKYRRRCARPPRLLFDTFHEKRLITTIRWRK